MSYIITFLVGVVVGAVGGVLFMRKNQAKANAEIDRLSKLLK